MKKIIIVLSLIAFISCKEKTKDTSNEKQTSKQTTEATINYASFGEKISEEKTLSASEMKTKYEVMEVGDTLSVKFKSTVESVCKKKGCWMNLKLDDNTKAFVRFKDYEFFVPLNAEDRETIVEGKAFVSETSVEELRHFAQDAGKSEGEIDAITEPKKEYAFMANGVLMSQ